MLANWPKIPIEFDLPNDVVHVFGTWMDEHQHQLEELSGYLSATELQQAYTFKFPHLQHRAIISRGMLRWLLSQYLLHPPESIPLAISDYGKPYLPNCNLQFNLAHSQAAVVYAFTKISPIGIDIEYHKTMEYLAISKRFFHPDEHHWLCHSTQLQHDFFTLWSQKEAVIKAQGQGLSQGLDSFSVLDSTGPWHIEPFEFAPTYSACLALERPPETIQYYHL